MKLSITTLGCPQWSLDEICTVVLIRMALTRGMRDVLDVTAAGPPCRSWSDASKDGRCRAVRLGH